MFAPSAGLVANCGYARTAIYQLFSVTKETKNTTSSSSKDDQQTDACGEDPNLAGENVDNGTLGISVPQSEHGDTVGMQEGECTTTEQESHEHIKCNKCQYARTVRELNIQGEFSIVQCRSTCRLFSKEKQTCLNF